LLIIHLDVTGEHQRIVAHEDATLGTVTKFGGSAPAGNFIEIGQGVEKDTGSRIQELGSSLGV